MLGVEIASPRAILSARVGYRMTYDWEGRRTRLVNRLRYSAAAGLTVLLIAITTVLAYEAIY